MQRATVHRSRATEIDEVLARLLSTPKELTIRRSRKPYARNYKAKDPHGIGRVRLSYCEWCGERTRATIPYASPQTPHIHEHLCPTCNRAARHLDALAEGEA